MSQNQSTAEEFVETLTGYDEIAIEKHMDYDFYEAAEAGKNVKLLRALVFVDQTRAGLRPTEARKAALDMTSKTLGDYFADDEPDELDPDAPDSESGKDDSATG